MLKNIFLKTLRDYRWSILIWGGGMAVLLYYYCVAYNEMFGGPNKAKLMQDYIDTVGAFSFFTGKAYDVDTLGGFLTTEFMSIVPALIAIVGMIIGSGLIRGEEEKGSLDLLLAAPHSRVSVLLQKWAGASLSILAICALCWLGVMVGSASANQTIGAGEAALAFLNVALVVLIFVAIGLVAGQFTSRKAAAGWSGGLLAATYMLNSAATSIQALEWVRYISPFYYFNLSKPLARSVGVDWWAMLVLFVVPFVLVPVALWLYLHRDLGSYFTFRTHQKVVHNNHFKKVAKPASPWLNNTFVYALRGSFLGVLIWGLGTGAYVVLVVSVINDLRKSWTSLMDSPFFSQLGFSLQPNNESIINFVVFLFVVVLAAAYAIVQVAGWTSEENEGRLELILSTPEPRWKLLFERFLVLVISSALMLGIVGLCLLGSAALWNVTLNIGNVFAALFALWILSILVGAAGYAITAFEPGIAVAIISGLVVVSYIMELLKTLLKLPGWLVDLSIFHQYGEPLINGLDWAVVLGMVGLSVGFLLVATVRFWRRDIVKL